MWIHYFRNRRQAVTCVFLLLGSYSVEGASLSGKVTAADSLQPLSGVSVLAFRQPLDPVRGPIIQKVQSASDGAYRFINLTEGTYHLCARAEGDYLDPCQWSQPVSVLVGTADLTRDVSLARGVAIAVIADDPKRLLSSLAAGPNLLSGAVSNEAGRLRHLVFRNAGTQLVAVQVVPLGVALQLRVASKSFLLSDDKGAPIDQTGHTVRLVASLPPPRRVIAPGYRLPFEAPGRKFGAVIRIGLRDRLPGGGA